MRIAILVTLALLGAGSAAAQNDTSKAAAPAAPLDLPHREGHHRALDRVHLDRGKGRHHAPGWLRSTGRPTDGGRHPAPAQAQDLRDADAVPRQDDVGRRVSGGETWEIRRHDLRRVPDLGHRPTARPSVKLEVQRPRRHCAKKKQENARSPPRLRCSSRSGSSGSSSSGTGVGHPASPRGEGHRAHARGARHRLHHRLPRHARHRVVRHDHDLLQSTAPSGTNSCPGR